MIPIDCWFGIVFKIEDATELNQNWSARRHIGSHKYRKHRWNRNSSKRQNTENNQITDDVTSKSGVFCDLSILSLSLSPFLAVLMRANVSPRRSVLVRFGSLRLCWSLYFKINQLVCHRIDPWQKKAFPLHNFFAILARQKSCGWKNVWFECIV